MTRIPVLLILLLLSAKSFSQETMPFIATNGKRVFSETEKEQKASMNEHYSVRIGSGDDIVNGRDYFLYHYRSKYKPFLLYEKKRTASITMNGRKYDGLVLQYDTYTDEVVYPEIENDHYPNLYYISLNKDIISSFTLHFDNDSLTFRNFNKYEHPGFNLPYGFYELVYQGETEFVIKHRSVVHAREGIDEYFDRLSWYVRVGDSYHKIKSSGNFIKLFGDRSAEMKKIINASGLKFGKVDKNQIVNFLRQFDNNSNTSK